MSKNLYKGLFNPSHEPNRNGFDRSEKHLFTTQAGYLIPIGGIETVPGSHYKVDVSALVRTFPMNSAAFMRTKIHYDVYFVPYTQLYHNFNAFLGQSTDVPSSANNNVGAFAPNFDVMAFVRDLGTNTVVDRFGLDANNGIRRMLDMLGYGRYSSDNTPSATAVAKPNLFRVLAYNKIWYDYYRNRQYDNTTVGTYNYVDYYNVDDITAADMTLTDNNRLRQMFIPKPVQWKKDLIQGRLPSTQFGAVQSVIDLNLSQITSAVEFADTDTSVNFYAGLYRNSAGLPMRLAVRNKSTNQMPSGGPSWNITSSSNNVLAFRRNLAIQKWKEYRLRAGNDSSSIQKAFFGVKPEFDMDNHPLFLGSFQNDLSIDEVLSTTNNGPFVEAQSAPLGAIGGKGIAVINDHTIDFSCKDMGVIMAVCYIRPEAEYESYGIDRSNMLVEPSDFFNPAYENLGLEAIPAGILNAGVYASNINTVIGYAPRYYNYKTGIDKVHNCFNAGYTVGSSSTQVDGQLSYWVPSRHDIISNGAQIASLYVNPKVMNKIFVGQINYGREEEDQFMLNTYIRVHAVQPMSKLGLPTL